MKQIKLIASLLIGASLISTSIYANTSLKGEGISAPYNWTGFYAGLNLGAVNHTMDVTDNDATSFFATLNQVSNPQFTGGLQLGYRRQLDLLRASGVYGLEFSANFSDASFSQEFGSSFAVYQLDTQHSLEDLCLLQLIGGIAADRTLLFLAAGLSWVNITGSMTSINGVPFFNSVNLDKSAFGTALGAGMEYAFSEKISARIKVDVVSTSSYSTTSDTDDSFQISNNIVQGTVGLNYKFF